MDRVPKEFWSKPTILNFSELEYGQEYFYPIHQIVMDRQGRLWLSKSAYYETETGSRHWLHYAKVQKTSRKEASITFQDGVLPSLIPMDRTSYSIKVTKIKGLGAKEESS